MFKSFGVSLRMQKPMATTQIPTMLRWIGASETNDDVVVSFKAFQPKTKPNPTHFASIDNDIGRLVCMIGVASLVPHVSQSVRFHPIQECVTRTQTKKRWHPHTQALDVLTKPFWYGNRVFEARCADNVGD
mmetsp:Transcript_12972/g.15842  ORF Transcript_12972/g.15842 Transcript_12972/m.15842 type:complete len:131 (-) Transcript_12972:749-1141(-)